MKENAGKYSAGRDRVGSAQGRRRLHHDRRPHRQGDPRGGGAGAAAIMAVGACAHWGSVQAARPNPTGAVGVSERDQGQAGGQHRRLPADRRRGDGDGGAFPDLRPDAGGGRRRPAALRVRRPDPRSVLPARQFRRRPVRRGVRRRGGAEGVVPLPRGLQGAGDFLALPDLPVELGHQLADRRGASLHRLHRAELLGHDDAVLRPAARRGRLRGGAAGGFDRRRAGRRRDRRGAGARGGHGRAQLSRAESASRRRIQSPPPPAGGRKE